MTELSVVLRYQRPFGAQTDVFAGLVMFTLYLRIAYMEHTYVHTFPFLFLFLFQYSPHTILDCNEASIWSEFPANLNVHAPHYHGTLFIIHTHIGMYLTCWFNCSTGSSVLATINTIKDHPASFVNSLHSLYGMK